ncbi:MAG TPA: zinc ribbon domain-containing protein [Pyrinomonadaceae bacterium]|nr:zinc ribbon domain-containing protein [Pyrinomonadaceae bacterium]
MLPEIARRCESCGAAIRVYAVFCPQCGAPLKREEEQGKSVEVEVSESRPKELNDELKITSMLPQPIAAEQISGTNEVEPATEAVPAAVSQPELNREEIVEAKPAEDGSTAEVEKKRHSMAAAARGRVQENLRPRVEKLKQTSAVVLDEAAEDPSLRFVLVAALLIILSVIILLLSLLR